MFEITVQDNEKEPACGWCGEKGFVSENDLLHKPEGNIRKQRTFQKVCQKSVLFITGEIHLGKQCSDEIVKLTQNKKEL